MVRGLEGRRVAVCAPSDDDVGQRRVAVLTGALEKAGARIQLLSQGTPSDEDFQGAKYAALVLIGNGRSGFGGDPRLVQLAREFLASDKPVAAIGGAQAVILEAGGAAGHTVAAHGPLKTDLAEAGATVSAESIHVDDALITAQGSVDIEQFAATVVRELSNRLEERELDEMSESSFPASDPPAITPAKIGRVSPDPDPGASP
jgi:putative intracellular protease/amidase